MSVLLHRARLTPWLLVVALALGCGPPDGPAGEYWVAEGEALRATLTEIASLRGTKIGRIAEEQLQRLPSCDRLSLHCPSGPCPPDAVPECGLAPTLEGATLISGDWNWTFQRPLGPYRIRVRGARSPDGRTRGEVEVPRQLLDGSILVPADRVPTSPFTTPHRRVLHLLVRPEAGLDVASLVTEEGWASQLFALKSELFAATTLDGTLELAIYEGDPGQVIPPTVLSVPFTHRQRAKDAMLQFVDEIQGRWPVRLVPVTGADGQCVENLDLLPDLAPCYIVTDRELVVGWNFGSLLASSTEAPGEPFPVDVSHLEVDFESLSRADRVVRASTGSLEDAIPYPWSSLRIAGAPDEDFVRFRFELTPRRSDP